MVRINLLPIRETLRKRELTQFLIVAGGILLLTVVLLVLTYAFLSMQISSKRAELGGLEKRLAKLKEENKEIDRLTKELAHLETQVKTITELTKTRVTPAPFMSALSLALPKEVWVSSVTKTNKSFSLDGQGLDNTTVVRFVQNLQKVRKDFTLQRPWVSQGDKTAVPFFADAKLRQITRTGSGSVAAMQFKIDGRLN